MVDLETMDNSPTSAIMAIGAVTFTRDGIMGFPFYAVVDLQSCLDLGLTVSGDTFYWWLMQDKQAQNALLAHEKLSVRDALNTLHAWYVGSKAQTIWAHGTHFDIAILETATRRVQRSGYPSCRLGWKYDAARDTRTLYDARDAWPAKAQKGVKHNALDDARNQALAVIAAMGQEADEKMT